jgi:hypothetical protein
MHTEIQMYIVTNNRITHMLLSEFESKVMLPRLIAQVGRLVACCAKYAKKR